MMMINSSQVGKKVFSKTDQIKQLPGNSGLDTGEGKVWIYRNKKSPA